MIAARTWSHHSHLVSHPELLVAAGTWVRLDVNGTDIYYLEQEDGTKFEVLVRKDAEYFNFTKKSRRAVVVSYKPGDKSYCSSKALTSASVYPQVRTRCY
jgi:hypothetical protein